MSIEITPDNERFFLTLNSISEEVFKTASPKSIDDERRERETKT
jgi:hypothetical protein